MSPVSSNDRDAGALWIEFVVDAADAASSSNAIPRLLVEGRASPTTRSCVAVTCLHAGLRLRHTIASRDESRLLCCSRLAMSLLLHARRDRGGGALSLASSQVVARMI